MSNIDYAMVRGKVVGAPQYMKNDGKERCHFVLSLECPIVHKDSAGAEMTGMQYFSIYVATDDSLTPRCKAMLDNGDEVLAIGEFGFHKGKMKLLARDMALPALDVDAIPTV